MSLIDVDGIEINFPYEPYQCQIAFMTKVIESLKKGTNAALESPTGTGKTLCLLCAAIAFINDLKSKISINAVGEIKGTSTGSLYPKILYASRTHSQLSQVVRELNKTVYKSTRTVTLASRDVLCIHENVQKESNNIVKSLMCRNLVRKRKCHYYNEYDRHTMEALDVLYSENGGVPDIEDLITTAKRHRQCPYFRVRSSFETADLILLPYNYIIDPRLQRIHGIKLEGNIVIFDEAHNLESICEESVSISFSSKDLCGSIREAKTVLEMILKEEEEVRTMMDNSDAPFGQLSEEHKIEVPKNDIAMLLARLQKLEMVIDDFKSNDSSGKSIAKLNGKVYSGTRMIELLEEAKITKDIREEISYLIDKIGQYITSKAEQSNVWNVNGTYLQQFSSFICTVYADKYDSLAYMFQINSSDATNAYNRHVAFSNSQKYQLYVTLDGTEIILNYWCFTPSIAMWNLHRVGVRSIIVTSGTLSPIDSFIGGLGVPFNVRLENRHAADISQVVGACIRANKSGNPICGTFNRRDNAYLLGVADLVKESCSMIPEGLLVFFSSYSVMKLCLDKWKQCASNGRSIWSEMSQMKKLFEEPKSKTELKIMLTKFRETIDSGRGAALFAVCRGKVSEGIDFADKESRGVIVIGLPYAPVNDARVELKKQFLTSINAGKPSKNSMTADEWYQTDAVRAVNQALGRVLRHKDDYGVVILADIRFCTLDRKKYPTWIRSAISNYIDISEFKTECQRFFDLYQPGFNKSLNTGSAIIRPLEMSNLCMKRKRSSVVVEKFANQSSVVSAFNDICSGVSISKKYEKNNSKCTSLLAEIDKSLAIKRTEESSIQAILKIEQTKKLERDQVERQRKRIVVDRATTTSVQSPLPMHQKPLEGVVKAILESWRRTPVQFKILLKQLPSLDDQKKIKSFIIAYNTNKEIAPFLDALTEMTIPKHPEVFRAIYGFLQEQHQSYFVVKCHKLGLIRQ